MVLCLLVWKMSVQLPTTIVVVQVCFTHFHLETSRIFIIHFLKCLVKRTSCEEKLCVHMFVCLCVCLCAASQGTFIRVLFPGEIRRRMAPDMATLEDFPVARRVRMSVSGRLVVCGWDDATPSSLWTESSSRGIRGALRGLEKARGKQCENIQERQVEEMCES